MYCFIVQPSHVQLFCSNPMDYSPLGSSVHGISQARILEWVAIFFSGEPLRTRWLNSFMTVFNICILLLETRKGNSPVLLTSWPIDPAHYFTSFAWKSLLYKVSPALWPVLCFSGLPLFLWGLFPTLYLHVPSRAWLLGKNDWPN